MSTMTGRTKALQECGCGCGKKAAWNHLHPVKSPNKGSFFVLDECRDAFEKELGYWKQIKDIRDALRGTCFITRWKAGRAWYCLQFLVRSRLMGPEQASKVARRDTVVFMLPRWAARLYIKFTGK
jgi:hypothetical protein